MDGTLKVHIQTLVWLGEETKAPALEKRASVTPRISYPDTWRDGSRLQTSRVSRFGNALAANVNDKWNRSNPYESDDAMVRAGREQIVIWCPSSSGNGAMVRHCLAFAYPRGSIHRSCLRPC